MSTSKINSLITQNRLLSQARSRARSQSTQIGKILNSVANSKGSLLDAIKKDAASGKTGLSDADAASKKNYTTMKEAAESLKTHTKNLLLWPEKDWDAMTEEEIAEYKEDVVKEVTNLVTDYNAMIKSMSAESSQVNEIYLKQLKGYFKNAKSDLESIGITQKEDGTLSVDQEKLKNADAQKIKKILGSSNSFVDDIGKRADNIIANAETNLAVINKSLYAGNYSYNKDGNDIFDILTSGSRYNIRR
ncbi:MAG: hypothetical protein K2G19_10920 [Lachnospiraceae bacterium]|nr:hypothetical protein [Lachnospiraceae bacterium]